MVQTQSLEEFLTALPKTCRTLRVKCGPTSRNLRAKGKVDFPGDVDPDERDLDEVAGEVEAALNAAGFDPDEGTYGIDALDDKGKKLRTWQDSESDVTPHKGRTKGRGDLEVLVDGLNDMGRSLMRVVAHLTGTLREERQYANSMRDEAVAQSEARHDAESLNAMLADQVERGVEGAEESAKMRGIAALETLVDKVGTRGAGKVTPKQAKDILRENPDILESLFDDEEIQKKFMEAVARRNASK